MAGLPDVDTFGDYAGAISNYILDVIDPTTDEDASVRNLYVANIAAMTQTIDRAIFSFLGPTAGQTMLSDPSKGFRHAAVWGAAAAVKPVGTYVSAGVIDIAWPTTVTDALGKAHTLSLKRGRAAIESPAGVFAYAKADVVSGNVVRVYTYDSSLSAADFAGYAITVWVR